MNHTENSAIENRINIDALLYQPDQLFDALVLAGKTSTSILISNTVTSYLQGQVIMCFLFRYRMFVRNYRFDANENCMCVLLSETIPDSNERGYLALQSSYSDYYYMNDCGGFDAFKKGSGFDLDQRLWDIWSILDPHKDDTILDIGCGRGELTYALARYGEARALGIDYSLSAIQIATNTYGNQLPNLEFQCEDIFQFADAKKFSKIVMADVIEHIEEETLRKIFRKVQQLLTDDGFFVIHTEPNTGFYEYYYPKMRVTAFDMGLFLPSNPRSYYEQLMHINEQSVTGLSEMCKEAFPHFHVWTGSMSHICKEKAVDEQNTYNQLFSICAKRTETIDEIKYGIDHTPKIEDCGAILQFNEPQLVLFDRTHDVITIPVTLKNIGNEKLSSRRTQPFYICYHVLQNGETIIWDGLRTEICRSLRKGEVLTVDTRVSLCVGGVPLDKGEYVIQFTLVCEGLFWFPQSTIAELPVKIL